VLKQYAINTHEGGLYDPNTLIPRKEHSVPFELLFGRPQADLDSGEEEKCWPYWESNPVEQPAAIHCIAELSWSPITTLL
jgi:hypothetical protein